MDDLGELVERALQEDVGAGDVTTAGDRRRRDARARADHAEGARRDLRAATPPKPRSRCSTATRAIERLVRGGRWREDGGPVLAVAGRARGAAERPSAPR